MSLFDESGEITPSGVFKLILWVVLFILGISALWSAGTVVGAGEQGVVTRFGQIKGVTLSPGFHWVAPFIDEVTIFDTREQKKQVSAGAASSDLQTVTAAIAVNHHVDPLKVNQLYQEIGIDFESRIVDPAIQESVKAATAQFTVSELITRRPEVKARIFENLKTRLASRYIIVDDVSITNFDFSADFNAAIEAKQVAQQQVQKAEQDLQRIKVEANQKIAQAQADAESQRLRQITLTPELLQKYAIDKWDGKLPYYMTSGSQVPFIQVPQK